MKKTVIFLLSAVFMLTIFSCGNKPAENLNDLKEKYKDKEFKNCDEFLVAYEEMMDVYFKTIDKLIAGDEQAAKDFEGFDAFMNNWNDSAAKFETECPEKMEEFGVKLEKEMEPYLDKLMDFYMSEAGYDEDFEDDFEDQMTDEDFSELEFQD